MLSISLMRLIEPFVVGTHARGNQLISWSGHLPFLDSCKCVLGPTTSPTGSTSLNGVKSATSTQVNIHSPGWTSVGSQRSSTSRLRTSFLLYLASIETDNQGVLHRWLPLQLRIILSHCRYASGMPGKESWSEKTAVASPHEHTWSINCGSS